MIARRFGTWPITAQVVVATAALMILLGIVASQQVLATLGRHQDARLQEFARLHVEGLAVALGPFALHKDIWEVYETLDRARTSSTGERILFTVVADAGGRVLAATDPARAAVDTPIAAFREGALPLAQLTAGNDDPVVRVAAPLIVQGRNVGQIVTELDVSDIVAQRRATTLALLAGNAAATLIVVVTGYLIVARMLKPIELLAAHMGGADGAPKPIAETEIPNADSVLAGLLHNFNDMAGAINSRRAAERRLAERERFVSLGRLSSSLAHEINNPLGGLLNAADTIRVYADRPDVVRNAADLLDRGLRHLRDVSRAILDENRLDRSGRALSEVDFDDLRLLFAPEVTRRRQRLRWRIGGGDEALRHWPSAPVRQIVLNLLLNASAAAPLEGEVALDVAADTGRLEIAVSDDGPGLTVADLQRLASEAPVAPGGGVGLRLVRDLARGLNGEVTHDRVAGRTVIKIGLPVVGGD